MFLRTVTSDVIVVAITIVLTSIITTTSITLFPTCFVKAQQLQEQYVIHNSRIVPLEHYDFTKACTNKHDTYSNTTNDNDTTTTTTTMMVFLPTSSYSSSLIGPLVSNSDTTIDNMFQCDALNGIYVSTSYNINGIANRIESNNTLSALQSYIIQQQQQQQQQTYSNDANNDNNTINNQTIGTPWSIAIWIQPNDITYPGRRAIVSIGPSNHYYTNNNMNNQNNNIPCNGYSLRIIQYYSNFVLFMMDETNTFCRTIQIKNYNIVVTQQSKTLPVIHFVISFDHTTMQIYINGQPMLNENEINNYTMNLLLDPTTTTTKTTNWNISTLQLFSNDIDQIFLGHLYQLDIYNTALTYNDIRFLYNHGIGYYYTTTNNKNYNSTIHINNTTINTNKDNNNHNNNETVIDGNQNNTSNINYNITTNQTTTPVVPYYYYDIDDDDYYYIQQQPLLIAQLSTTTTSSNPLLQGTIVLYQNDYNTFIPVLLHSLNQSNSIHQLGIQITSIPKHGILYYISYESMIDITTTTTNVNGTLQKSNITMQDKRIIRTNDIFLLYDDNTNIQIYYQLHNNTSSYFNIPMYDGYGNNLHIPKESFHYQIVEISSNSIEFTKTEHEQNVIMISMSDDKKYDNEFFIINQSNSIETLIYVVHINQRSLSSMTIVVPTFDDYQNETHNVNSNNNNNNNTSMIVLNQYQVMMRGIDIVFDTNHVDLGNNNLNYVRVDVLTSSSSSSSLHDSVISLNFDRLLLFTDTQYCNQRYYSNWQCTMIQNIHYNITDNENENKDSSSSISDTTSSSITFVALPNDIPLILNYMLYTSSVPGQGTNMTIRLYDGSGTDDCLHLKEHYMYYNISNSNWIQEQQLYDPNGALQATIMEYMLLQNSTCTVHETILRIPNFYANQQHNDHTKSDFTIFGFIWKEFVFGMFIIIMFLLCYCGCCTPKTIVQYCIHIMTILCSLQLFNKPNNRY